MLYLVLYLQTSGGVDLSTRDCFGSFFCTVTIVLGTVPTNAGRAERSRCMDRYIHVFLADISVYYSLTLVLWGFGDVPEIFENFSPAGPDLLRVVCYIKT